MGASDLGAGVNNLPRLRQRLYAAAHGEVFEELWRRERQKPWVIAVEPHLGSQGQGWGWGALPIKRLACPCGPSWKWKGREGEGREDKGREGEEGASPEGPSGPIPRYRGAMLGTRAPRPSGSVRGCTTAGPPAA